MPTRNSGSLAPLRKRPRQARAQATMESMLDAVAHILGRHGWAGLTTNAVAEVAGVSIGSLYQYFPNKRALVASVRKRHFDAVLEVMRVATNTQIRRAQRLAALVDGMIGIHRSFPAVWNVLLQAGPQDTDSMDDQAAFELAWTDGYKSILRINGLRQAADHEISALVLAGSISGAVHEAARQGRIDDAVFRQELLRLVQRCLS
ncbi:TetR/AcrR family transcriptional regulator [Frateuria aurantia]